jgi:hypothetical protein
MLKVRGSDPRSPPRAGSAATSRLDAPPLHAVIRPGGCARRARWLSLELPPRGRKPRVLNANANFAVTAVERSARPLADLSAVTA